MNRTIKTGFLLFACTGIIWGCRKDKQQFEDPYGGGKPPLGIQLSTDLPSPATGGIGTMVTFRATGLSHYKDSLHFYLNGETADVMQVDSGSIKVKVPETASTGVGYITVGDQIFFGPIFRVQGKLAVDNSFKAKVGANNSINDVLPLPDGRLVLVGSFSDFEHKGAVKPLNRIVMTSRDGEVDRSLRSGDAADGYLNSIATLTNRKMVIAGAFASFDSHRGEIHNITLLNSNGSLDTTVVRTPLSRDTVPLFNGGTDGTIQKIFVRNNMITAIGNFNYYLQFVYNKANYQGTRDSLVTDSISVRNLVRFFPDGALDSSFNYDFQRQRGKQGPNGPITDGFMQSDGKLIIVGRFTKYNGENANNIARLNEDGSLDRTFKVGTGTDDVIATIKYNPSTARFILAGGFEHFNGVPSSGLVMLHKDGTMDPTFKPAKKGNSDIYVSAQQLSNGYSIISGFFKKYDGIHRGNLMVLDSKGQLAKGYNTTGDFQGVVNYMLETRNSSGEIQVLIAGGFYKFDEQEMGNIMRLVFKE
ncbi:DUF5008 domain-containing protein [Compostibacter hankyongensis]